MNRAYYLNTHFKNLIKNGTLLDDNLKAFLDKVVELKPESVYDVGFELGHRLSQLYGMGISTLGGCETDLLCGTYGHNHFNLFDIPNLYLEFFNSIEEATPKKNWDLAVFYGERPSKEIIDKLSPFFKRMLFWTTRSNWEVYIPNTEPEENLDITIDSVPSTSITVEPKLHILGDINHIATEEEIKALKNKIINSEDITGLSWGPELSFTETKTLPYDASEAKIEGKPNDSGQ